MAYGKALTRLGRLHGFEHGNDVCEPLISCTVPTDADKLRANLDMFIAHKSPLETEP